MIMGHPDAARSMLAALDAAGPAEAQAAELMLAGRFAGSRDLAVRWYEWCEVVR